MQEPHDRTASAVTRSHDVFDLDAQGYTDAEIGKRLFIFDNTIKTHLSRVYPKVEVDGRADLARQVGRRTGSSQFPRRPHGTRVG